MENTQTNDLQYAVVVYANDKCVPVRFKSLFALGGGRGYEDYRGRRCRICSRHESYEQAKVAASLASYKNNA